MKMYQKMGLLLQIPVLRNFDYRQSVDKKLLTEIAKIAAEQTVPQQEVITRQGEEASALHIIVEGEVHVYKNGNTKPLATLYRGQVINDLALFRITYHPATLISAGHTELLTIRRDDFVRLMMLYPEIAIKIMPVLVKRIEEASGLMETWIREESELKRELEIATQIQQDMMPHQVPSFVYFEIDGYSKPAAKVGGDLYNILDHQGNLGVVIGDVSGKSVPAAMLMAISQGMVEMAVESHSCPADILRRVNRLLCRHIHKKLFVALCYAEFDLQTLTMTYAMAGLPSPILLRNQQWCELAYCEERLPLGQFPHLNYDEKRLQLQPDDVIIFTTDGIDEATNTKGQMYGTDRLLKTLAEIPPRASAREIREHILMDVNAFVGEAEPHDDLTLVVVKVL